MFPTLECRDDILKLLYELTDTRKKILEACEKLTDEQLNDPVYPETWSVLQNLQHLAWAEEFMLAWIRKRPDPLPDDEVPKEPKLDLTEIKLMLDDAHASVISFVKSNAPEVLKETCQYVPHRGPQTVGGLLYHVVEHEIGHRTFLFHKLKKLQQK